MEVDMKNVEFIRFVNNNNFTHICSRCIIPNGECFDIAKQGHCRVYNDKDFRKLWNIGLYNTEKKYQLHNNDCLIEMQYIPDKSIDMILCDLPYGQTTRNKWDCIIPFDLLWEQYSRIIKDNGVIVLFANGMFTADLMHSNRKIWRYNIIWEKNQPTGFLNANRMPLRSHEDICVFYKKQPVYNPQKTTGHSRKISKAEHKIGCIKTTNYGKYNLTDYDSAERYPKSVWKFSKDTQKYALHPTQKPVGLLEHLIKTYTNKNDLVLDNCMGSGSTGVACLHTERKFLGIEKDEHYFSIAKERLEKICRHHNAKESLKRMEGE